MNINILLAEGATMPAFKTDGAACADVCALVLDTINVRIKPKETALVRTGVCIELPKGYVAQMHIRSSMGFKKGIALINSTGIIDSDYRGEIMLKLINLGTETQVINHGDAVAQMLILKHEQPSFTVVQTLNYTARGTGGFGSTDI